jgi:hypothetical protein
MTLKTDKGIFIPNTSFSTPVLFLIFNRPETTQQVFSAIRKAKPPRLYVAADGPRSDYPDDAESCEIARSIATNVDWDCEVKTLFRETNLGCGLAVTSAIDWFFEQETEGMILEDDTKPSEQFFKFINFGLRKYRDDKNIGSICGYNPLTPIPDKIDRIIISNYPSLWGWGTWKNVWEKYSLQADFHYLHKVTTIYRHIKHLRYTMYILSILRGVEKGEIDTWCAQFGFMFSEYKFKVVYPPINLIENIGYGDQGTHTKGWDNTNKISNIRLDFMNLKESYDKSFDLSRFNIERPNIYNRLIRKCKISLKIITK